MCMLAFILLAVHAAQEHFRAWIVSEMQGAGREAGAFPHVVRIEFAESMVRLVLQLLGTLAQGWIDAMQHMVRGTVTAASLRWSLCAWGIMISVRNIGASTTMGDQG